MSVLVLRCDRIEAAEETHGDVVLGVDFGLAGGWQSHLYPRVDEEGAKQIKDPVKARDHAHADDDERRPHQHRADDAPEKHPMLIARFDLE